MTISDDEVDDFREHTASGADLINRAQDNQLKEGSPADLVLDAYNFIAAASMVSSTIFPEMSDEDITDKLIPFTNIIVAIVIEKLMS